VHKLQDAIFITGGGQRIGAFLVKQFLAQADCPVLFTYRTKRPQVDELIALGAIAIQVDFTDESALPGLVETIHQKVESLRAVIHNASLWLPDAVELNAGAFPIADLTVFKALFQVHVETPYYLNTALTPLLKASTKPLKDIISISDFSVDRVSSERIAYLASKSALQMVSKGFAKKLAPEIKVNDIAPALIIFNDGDSEAYKQKRLTQSALGIEPGVEVVWQAIQYLMNSSYTTGIVLPLEGGRSLL
jgi:dihydromonapterin reductase/dihydrofolate reductase